MWLSRLRELLQQSAISQGVGERDSFRRVGRPERTDPGETQGGSSPNDTTTTIVQSSTQKARDISSKFPLAFRPIWADSQQSLPSTHLDPVPGFAEVHS